MVVIQEANAQQTSGYLGWLHAFHAGVGMVFDPVYPAEVVSIRTLKQAMANLEEITLDLGPIEEKMFDAVVWTDVISGIRRGIVGNEELSFQLSRDVGHFPKRWKGQTLRAIEEGQEQNCKHARKDLPQLRKMVSDMSNKRFVGLEQMICSRISDKLTL